MPRALMSESASTPAAIAAPQPNARASRMKITALRRPTRGGFAGWPEPPAPCVSKVARISATTGQLMQCSPLHGDVYGRPSIQSVSACEPRPRAASIAALYPRNAWSLDMMLLVRGLSARSVRKPATAAANSPKST